MTLCEDQLERGDLGLGKLVPHVGNNAAGADIPASQPAKVIFCHVMDTTGSDVVCPWCEGHGSVTEDRQVVSAEMESEQLAERLRTQLERVKTALHLASTKIKELQKKPKRRHVNVQVDEKSIQLECGGADAEHHDENEEVTSHSAETELLMEQAAQALHAIRQLKVVKEECKELTKHLHANENLLNKRNDQLKRLKKDYESSVSEVNMMVEDVKEKEAYIETMKHQHRLGSTSTNDTHQSNHHNSAHVTALETEITKLRHQLQQLDVERAANALQGGDADWSQENGDSSRRVSNIHLEHATQVGHRLKAADHELVQLKSELVLKDVEIGKFKRDIEEALKFAATHHHDNGSGEGKSTQTDLTADGLGLEGQPQRSSLEEERAKTWEWLTQTHQAMQLEKQTPEVEEEHSPPNGGGRLPVRTTVREALEARKWLISKQAVMNWGVLTQTLLNIMEVGNVDVMYQQQQRYFTKVVVLLLFFFSGDN